LPGPLIPRTTITTIPTVTPTIASSIRAAPSPRGTRWRAIQEITGEQTAATIAATITGSAITLVSATSQTAPTNRTANPSRNHDIRPRLRSQSGTLKTRRSAPGSISMYCSRGSLPEASASPQRSRNLPRIIWPP
jgi:hypothetical protein